MAQPDYFNMQKVADQAWRDYMYMKSNLAMELTREQADHLQALETIVYREAPLYRGEILGTFPDGHARAGEEMTDFDYANFELEQAAGIYCMNVDCTDPGQDAAAKRVGMFQRTLGRFEDIYNDTQAWTELATGDPVEIDGEMQGGWMKRIAAAQQNFGGKHGTGDVKDVYDDVVNFRQSKDKTLTANAITGLEKLEDQLKDWMDQETIMKMQDMVNAEGVYDDSVLNYVQKGEPGFAENANLFWALERMQIGDVAGAKQFHNTWVSNFENREIADIKAARDITEAEAERIKLEEADMREEWEASRTRVLGLKKVMDTQEITSKNLGAFAPTFKADHWMEGYNVTKDGWNMTSSGAFRDMLARNMASWMNDFAEGDTEDKWNDQIATVEKANPTWGREQTEVHAANLFFDSMTQTDVQNMSQGRIGSTDFLMGWGRGLDFPGTGTQEKAAERYFNATYNAWSEANETIKNPALNIMPEGPTQECPPGDPLCFGTNIEYEKPYYVKGTKVPSVNTMGWDVYEDTDRLRVAEDVNLTPNDQSLLNTLVATADDQTQLLEWIEDLQGHGRLGTLDTLQMNFPEPQPDDGNMMELVRMLDDDAQGTAKELLEPLDNNVSLPLNTVMFDDESVKDIQDEFKIIVDMMQRNDQVEWDSYGANKTAQAKELHRQYHDSNVSWEGGINQWMLDNVLQPSIPTE